MNFRHTCPKDGGKSCCSGHEKTFVPIVSLANHFATRCDALSTVDRFSPLSFFELFPCEKRNERESPPHRYSMLLTQPFCPSLPIVSYQWRGKFLRERSSRLSLSLSYLSVSPPPSHERGFWRKWNCGQSRDRNVNWNFINAIFLYILRVQERCF